MIPRRFLPPTSLLYAFEAAARLQSFTLAARELHLTQSAISRQIRSLEDMLGAPLFHRERQKVHLTLAGGLYARQVRDALGRISNATLGFRANPEGGTLQLATLPLFGSRWLMPRLPRFRDAHPDVAISISTCLMPFNFQGVAIDAAIHFGQPVWPGAKLDPLIDESVLPVCSPALRSRLGPISPEALAKAPLLHLISRPDAWERWFALMNVDPGEVHGMLLDQFALCVDAARAGLGVALLPYFLISPELKSGELVPLAKHSVQQGERYYLAWPEIHVNYAPLEAFRHWLATECLEHRGV
jgi:LysR family glycine cleavage system transcriptional activator